MSKRLTVKLQARGWTALHQPNEDVHVVLSMWMLTAAILVVWLAILFQMRPKSLTANLKQKRKASVTH